MARRWRKLEDPGEEAVERGVLETDIARQPRQAVLDGGRG